MSRSSYMSTIRSYFSSQFGALQPNVGIAWPNVSYSPEAPNPEYPIASSWVRPYVGGMVDARHTHGGTHMVTGWFHVQIFTPLNVGPGHASDIEASVLTAIRNKTTNEVQFLDAYEDEEVGISESGDWWQLNVAIPFIIMDEP